LPGAQRKGSRNSLAEFLANAAGSFPRLTFMSFFAGLLVSIHLRLAWLAEVACCWFSARLLAVPMFDAGTNAFIHGVIVHALQGGYGAGELIRLDLRQ
jgi:hypothetical protein